MNIERHMLPVYKPLMEARERYLVLYGGAGSGKSVLCDQKLLTRSMLKPGHRFVAMRKVARTLRLSVWALLNDTIAGWGLEREWHPNKTEMSLVFKPNGSSIHCLGVDDREKIKSLAGISGFWLEEPTELSEEDFDQLDLRLRGQTVGYKQILMSFNPVSSRHWIKRRFFDDPPADCRVLKTTYRDNPFAGPEYARMLEELERKNPGLAKIYKDGDWGTLEGMIYAPPEQLAPWPEDPDEVIRGLDFGFAESETALVTIEIKGLECWLREEVYAKGLIVSDLLAEMNERLLTGKGRTLLDWERNRVIYADPARPESIEELARGGWAVVAADKGTGSVKDSIDFVQGLTLHVPPGSPNLLNEFESYVWRKNARGEVMEEPVKFRDHLMDAMRYALWSHLKGRTMGKREEIKLIGRRGAGKVRY